MKSFIKNKKLMAWVVLLTFLFSCVMPSNIMSGNSIAEAKGHGSSSNTTINVTVEQGETITLEGSWGDWHYWKITKGSDKVSFTTATNQQNVTISGDAVGTATITHKYGDKTTIYSVTVTAKNTSGDVTPTTPEITGTVDISKTAVRSGADEWDVTMTIGADSQTTDNTLNIVLVMDRSNSMTKDMMSSAKTAAENFVTTLSTKNIPANVGVVEFGTNGSTKIELTQIATADGANTANVTNVKNAIKGINEGGGGTNLQHGLILANELLDGKTNAYIVILSDGQPTYYMVQNNGKWSKEGKGTADWISTSSTKTQEYVNTYLKTNANLKIVTIAFGDLNNTTKEYYAGLSSDPANLYFSGGVNDINTIFGNIASQILYLMKSGTVTDNMDDTTVSDIDIVVENGVPKDYVTNNGSVAIDATNNNKFVWTLVNPVTRDNPATLTYTVKAREILVGEQYPILNGQADLVYLDSNDKSYNDVFNNPAGMYEAAQLNVSYDGLPESATLPWNDSTITTATWASDIVITDWDYDAKEVKENPSATVGYKTVKEAVGNYIVENVTVTEPGKEPVTMTLAEFEEKYPNDKMDILTGYTSIVYHYAAPTIEVKVTKVWDDNQNQDGIRPGAITIHLNKVVPAENPLEWIKSVVFGTNPTEEVDAVTVTANANGNWEYTFKDLPKYENGEEIEYKVTEDAVAGYTTSAPTGSMVDGFVITNTHEIEKTAVVVEKAWVDGDNQDGIRPENVTVQLYADDIAVEGKTLELNQDNNWTGSFADLDVYKAGEAIVYTVDETEVPDGYTRTVGGDAANGFVITNTHAPAKTSVAVTKAWEDSNNQDGIRPENVTVQLYADDVAVEGKTATLNVSNNWSASFDNLDVNKAGNEIVYTVAETDVPDTYKSVVSGNKTDGLVITNKHKVEKTSVSGTKTWNDAENQDGKRPESITVRLHADGVEVAHKTVTATDEWKYSFTDLDKNKAGKAIVYTITEDAVTDYTTTYNGYNITNSYTPEKVSIDVTKAWDDDSNRDNIRPTSVTVQLKANGVGSGEAVTLNADNNWTYTWTELAKKAAGADINYTVVETSNHEGYTAAVTGNVTEGFTVTNTHTPETVNVSGTKTWKDNNNAYGTRPDSITVQLYANGEAVNGQVATVTPDANGNWNYTFENQLRYENGVAITYTVKETAVIGKYVPTYSGMNITNILTDTIDVSVTKAWADSNNQDGIRPNNITVQLKANDSNSGDAVTLNAANGWATTWTELAKYDANGVLINYTVVENDVPEGYTSVTTGDAAKGYTITNTHVPEVTKVTVTKAWNDANNQDGIRASEVQVQLKADGSVTETAVLNDANNWTTTWDNLPKKASGTEINYTVEEINVPAGYTATQEVVNGVIKITNAHTPEKTTATVTKHWADNNNQDGIRPTEITVQLYADGVAMNGKTATVAATADWKYTFTDLDKYANGKLINYTVQENAVSGYEATYDGMNITNTHTPATIDIPVAKVWDDSNNQDGKRPESITVELYKDGVKTNQSLTLNEGNNWTATFKDLAEYENGVKVQYSVREYGEDNNNEINFNSATYTVKHAVNDEGVYTITNSYTPEETKVSVTKVWNDANNQDGQRSTSVTVQLKANGVNEGAAVTLDDANHWTYEWTGLAKYAAGEVISYTVEETNVKAGYTPSITGTMAEGYTITNSYTPETTSVSGEKTWIDKGNESLRPSSITVNLYGEVDGKTESYGIPQVVKANAEGKWTYTFDNLPKYKGGVEIKYSVTEEKVDNYTASYNGTNIVNTIAQDYLSIQAVKAWENVPVDANGKEILPNEIVLVVNQDGVEYASQTVTAADEWQYTFANLPKYDVDGDGHKYKYTMYEKPVNGYVPTYSIVKVAADNGGELYQLNITNTYVDNNNVVNIEVNKVWQTASETVPAITVNLLQGVSNADGTTTWTEIDEKVLNGKDDTTHTFTNLPKYYQDTEGNKWEYAYKVTEDAVDGYTTTIVGNAESGFRIYNTAYGVGQLVVSKTATGGNKPAADTDYNFVLLIDAGQVDIDLLARQNGMREEAKKLAAAADESVKTLQIAEANFMNTTRITSSSEYRFVFYNNNHVATYGFGGTTPGVYHFESSTTSGVYNYHIHDHGYVIGVDHSNWAKELIERIVQAVKNVFAQMGSFFDIPVFMELLDEETSASGTTPSAMAFHFDSTVKFMKASRDAELAKGRAEAAKSAVDEFPITTPSAITVTFGEGEGKQVLNLEPSKKDQYFNDEAEYYIIPFSLKDGKNLGFDIKAENTEGNAVTIKYMIVEQNIPQANFLNTTIDVTDGEGTRELDNHMTAWTNLTTGAAYTYAFTNEYSTNTTPPGDPDPEPPVTPPTTTPDPDPEPEPPEEIDIPEEEVPLAEPGIEIEEPEVPLAEPEVPLGEAPATGDTTNAVPFLCMLLVGLVGFLVSRTKFN